MLQPLVKRRANKYLRRQLPPRHPTMQRLVPMPLIPQRMQHPRHIIHRQRRIKRSPIPLRTSQRRDLPRQALHQLPDGHPRGDGVRVNDNIRRDALLGKRHVLLPVGHSNRPLLPVARGELIADLRDADVADADFDEFEAFFVGGEDDAVDDPALLGAHAGAAVFFGEPVHGAIGAGGHDRGGFPDQDVAAIDADAGGAETVFVEAFVGAEAHAFGGVAGGDFECFGGEEGAAGATAFFFVLVAAVEGGAEEAPVDGGLVHDEGVFLVVAAGREGGREGGKVE